jgi:hypothetical protein
MKSYVHSIWSDDVRLLGKVIFRDDERPFRVARDEERIALLEELRKMIDCRLSEFDLSGANTLRFAVKILEEGEPWQNYLNWRHGPRIPPRAA